MKIRRIRYPVPMEPALRPHRGGTVLGLGILGLASPFLYLPLGALAWWLGKRDLLAMEDLQMDPRGRTITQVGLVFGVLGMAFWIFVILATATACFVIRYLPD